MIRIGNSEDIFRDAAALRKQVFMEEQGFEHEFDGIDEKSIHAVLYLVGEPVATGRAYINEQGDYTIGRVAVKKQHRGQGLGEQIMRALEEEIKGRGGKSVQLSAQLSAKGFYEKQGYQAVGEEYLDEFCPHIKMVKQL